MAKQTKKPKQKLSPQDLKRLLSYAKPYRGRIIIALLSLLISSVLGLMFPQLVRILIDSAFTERNMRKLNIVGVLLFVLFASQAAFNFLRAYWLSYSGERIVADLRSELYSHLIRLPASFFVNRRVGELSSRLASDVTIVQTVTTGSLTEFLRQVLTLVGGVLVIAITNPRLTVVMLAIVPLVMLSAQYYGRYIKRLSTNVQDRLAESNSVLQETLSSSRIVQSFVKEDYETGRYRQRIDEALKLAVHRAIANGGFIAFITFVVYSGIGVVLWAGSRMVLSSSITPGDLIAFVLYTFVVANSVSSLSAIYGQFQQAIGATRRVFELLDTVSEIRDPENPQSLGKVSGEVQLKDVHFTYPDERNIEVLKGVTIKAESGKIMAVVGPSGAGKSTLISLIPRFYDVTSGAILVDGKDVRTLRIHDLRNIVGIVPQETVLFAGTIRENVAYGNDKASHEEIEAATQAANAHEFITGFPEGYNTPVGEQGVKLSAGQRQRIAIARALLKNPAILILDEATSSLDSESEKLVQDALETLMQGRTTLVIAHRLSTVRRADKIIVLNSGEIVEEGTHEELLANEGLYKQLYDIQFKDEESALALSLH